MGGKNLKPYPVYMDKSCPVASLFNKLKFQTKQYETYSLCLDYKGTKLCYKMFQKKKFVLQKEMKPPTG